MTRWLDVECPNCKITPGRYCLGGPDVVHESRLIAAEARRVAAERDTATAAHDNAAAKIFGPGMKERLRQWAAERFDAAWISQDRAEQRRRLGAVIALAVELGKILKGTNFSTRLCEFAIEKVIEGDWAAVRDYADYFAFTPEDQELRVKYAPVFASFRELLVLVSDPDLLSTAVPAAPLPLPPEPEADANSVSFADMTGKIVRRVTILPAEKDRQLPVSCEIDFADGSFFTITSDYVWDRATDGSLNAAGAANHFVGKEVKRTYYASVRSIALFPLLFAIDFADGAGIVMKSSSSAFFMDGRTHCHVRAPVPLRQS